MKTKHLFYSLALASAFTACTQEELVNAPVVKDNIADRPVAGVVEFSTEGVESRFNYEKGNGFELGDVFGLYLMDEFVDGDAIDRDGHKAEHKDANGTYWKYQNHWFGMYQFTNSIQSNYPFRYVNENGKNVWKNDAKLVEGNYFAMFPQNEVALNRRELWHVIDPTVELKKVSSSTTENQKYQNVENQFWLGYKQIYRDATASAEGVMSMNIDMTGVMAPIRFIINNNSNNDVILHKISFKNQLGNALPTLAYVRPAEKNWVKSSEAYSEFDCNYPYAYDLYDETKTWTKQTVQNIVEWTVPGKETVPYGLVGKDTNPAYEYSFSYPADVTLKGNVNGGSLLTTYIVLPAMENEAEWRDLQVCIYGWQKDNSSSTGWTYGMLTTKQSSDDENYTFDLYDRLNYWDEQAEQTSYYRDVNVKFSEFAWKAVDQSEVANTTDMENMVLSFLAQNSGNQDLTIAPDANGIEITAEFINKLYNDSKNNGRVITLNFSGLRGGKITFNDNETMDVAYLSTETVDYLKFNYIDGIQLINNATQTIYSQIGAPIENNGTLTVINGAKLGEVTNYNKMTVGANDWSNHGGEVVAINNYGTLTLKDRAVVGTLNNLVDGVAGKVVVDAFHHNNCSSNTAIVTRFNNEFAHECSTCLPSELTTQSGTLAVSELFNNAKLTVNAGSEINVAVELRNNMHKDNGANVYALVNNGTIKGNGVISNRGIINNYGKISSAILKNMSTINGHAGEIWNLSQDSNEKGTLNVWSENIKVYTHAVNGSHGDIIFKGVAASQVALNGSEDARIFEVQEEGETLISLMTKMQPAAALELRTAKDITLNWDDECINVLKYRSTIEKINVVGNATIRAEKQGQTYTFAKATLTVAKNKTLYVDGVVTLNVKDIVTTGGNIIVGSNSVVKGGNVTLTHSSTNTEATVTGSTDGNM